ncbi:MAG: type II toxin-antitoxin system Phd/YefM family antitoxin [Gammaproteobacteria bacterium]|nr:type II toxin-antitoxin system Phd/YefM family antitoxin [Gammaproteobacteria bacterium]MYE82793.1 type II toxin-antitoxin system Phd/YefM family antitoxin [Gammaproteobacteria bacterium]
MDFISVRELRSRSAAVWEALEAQRRMVVTSNGKPIAFLVATSPEIFDSTLEALRQAEALQALESIRQSARESGAAELSLDEIDAEIAAARAARRP